MHLARQAIPLRGTWDESISAERDSNFYQLLMMRSEEDRSLIKWLERKQQKYISPDIQNEMLEVSMYKCKNQITLTLIDYMIATHCSIGMVELSQEKTGCVYQQ